jgi:hypothetical protein
MRFTTGRVVTLARTDSVAFVAIVLPRIVLTVGRKHIWRLRDRVAVALPPDIRELLTRGRSGRFDNGGDRVGDGGGSG